MPPTALITGRARGIGHAIAADLARDQAGFITGEILTVAGGYRL